MVFYITLFVFGVALIFTAIFKAVYGHFYEKRKNKDSEKKREWLVPGRLSLIVFVALMVLGLGILIPISLSKIDMKHATAEEIFGIGSSKAVIEIAERPQIYVEGNINENIIAVSNSGNITVEVISIEGFGSNQRLVIYGSVSNLEADDVNIYVHYVDENKKEYDVCKYYHKNGDVNTLYYEYTLKIKDISPFRIIVGTGYGSDYKYKRDGLSDQLDVTYSFNPVG
ncbi:MAG: hypothetical protein IKZ29_06600 [Clostridiales bacterium]|nr:hypothetical protein [Clostridiales bacterium]